MHCIALHHSRPVHSYRSSHLQCCVSLHHGPFLAAFATQDSCLLPPRLQDRVLHCHHLTWLISPPSFFFLRPVPTPARLPRMGPICSSVILHRLAAGWRGVGHVRGGHDGGGDLLVGGWGGGAVWLVD